MRRLKQAFQRLQGPVNQGKAHLVVFLLILALGIFARTWEFGQLPPSIDLDEAATAVDAYDLYKYGVDRNGMAYPVEFVSWGEGQNALYGYLLIPFLAVAKELSPEVVRMPMLLAGIASLPLAYLLGKALVDSRLGLLAMFFLAISPWHILLSRWGKEVNLFPFVFLAAFVCFLRVRKDSRWFIPGCVLLALCLYAYGTSYVMVPTFLLFLVVLAVRKRALGAKTMILGLACFALVAAPIAAVIVVNAARLHSINLGPFTIPRFPSAPRFENQTLLGDATQTQTITKNLADAVALLATQTDGIVSDEIQPYGYFYAITFPVALLGILIVFQLLRDGAHSWEASLLLAWIGASIPIAILLSVNIGRFNIIFIPLIVCMALAVHWLSLRIQPALPIAVCVLLVAFTGFTIAYHGPAYRQQLDAAFTNGLLPALGYARQLGHGPICAPGSGYIYVLFVEHQDPATYLRNIQYDHLHQPNRRVISAGRYSFGSEDCRPDPRNVYVNLASDPPPAPQAAYETRTFDNYVVYCPKP